MRRVLHRMKLGVAMAALLVVAATGCEAPELTALVPSSGPPGTVVQVGGTNISFASVLWDAATGAESELDSSFLSARFFTVPRDAAPGAHAVQLDSDMGRSATTLNFTVIDETGPPGPRIDDITVAGYRLTFGVASMVLMVHGANLDVGATIEVFNIPLQTEFSRLLRNDAMNATDPGTLGYPIFHYGTLWAPIAGFTPGSLISVVVVNEDGTRSEPYSYRIAPSLEELDSDGDGLPDDWERNGYDADDDGRIDVDLPALGADPFRKDMFIEADWMEEATPNSAIWTNIEDTFANAPILNTDGSQGIAMHIDRGAGSGGGGGDIVPFAEYLRYDDNSWSDATYENFFDIKEDYFDEARQDIFRYCVFAWDQGHHPGSSGRAADIPARDFFVSMASWGAVSEREDYLTSTFLHELGHTVDLRHGGHNNAKRKPNYNSVMGYGRFITLVDDELTNYSPSQFGGIDTDCDLDNMDRVYTFSQGQRADLDESDLNEFVGVCDNVPFDWDFDDTLEMSVSINFDGIDGIDVMTDYADWAYMMVPLP